MPSKRKSSACVDYVPALCTHRPSLLPIEWFSEASWLAPTLCLVQRVGGREVVQTWSFRGSKSRNKVSVGEPAEGSLTRIHVLLYFYKPLWTWICEPFFLCAYYNHYVVCMHVHTLYKLLWAFAVSAKIFYIYHIYRFKDWVTSGPETRPHDP